MARKAPKRIDDDDDTDDVVVSKPAGKPKQKPELPSDDDAEDTEETTAVSVSIRGTRKVLDNRVLREKQKEELRKRWTGNNRGKTIDAFMQGQVAEARTQFGSSGVFIGDDTAKLVIGIPCPAIAFEYLICQDCYPLGLVLQIVARHGIGKSALLAEIGRWFQLAGGGFVLCENETKFNPDWYCSIMGYSEFLDRVPLHRCDSVESWQEHLTFAIKQMQRAMRGTKEAPGPGKTFPALFGVDSIMGKMSREVQEKILGKVASDRVKASSGMGYAEARQFPVEAGSITKYMRTIPQVLDAWPFSLVLINHLRNKKDDAGNLERNKTGGEQVNFQESFELELKRRAKIATQDFEGEVLELSCEKNSFGPTGRRIQVRLIWWHEQNAKTGALEQRTVWDWDWSTVQLLNNLLNGDRSSTYLRKRLKDIGFHLDCPKAGDSDSKAWSRTLGMTKDDAVTWSELGAMIREDKELCNKLRDALAISHRPQLAGDYTTQKIKLSEDLP